jgi:riboflavin transporter FmnP
MPLKLIKQGYKLFSIVDHGYIYSWIWSLKIFFIKEVKSYDSLTNTGAFVRALVATLPCTQITIYLNNYFILIPLFSSFCTRQYGAVGITRPHALFPTALLMLKKRKEKA